MIRKRLLSACLALALCLSLLPVTALAADGDTVYVGGVALTCSTGSPAYATTDTSGNVSSDGSESNYNIKWDGSTLTLNGAKIKGADSSESLSATVGIYAFNSSGDVSLNIALKGVNEIFESSNGIWVYSSSSSTNAGNATLTIEGEGSLNASGGTNGIQVQSNSGNAALTIRNADVTAENSIYSGDGVTVRAGSSSSASLSVDSGSLTATGTGVGSGINFLFGSGVSGSGMPSLTVSGNTIVRANGGIANNSSTSIQYGTGNEENGGIVFDGNEGTVYGSVTLQEDLTIGEGESLALDSGASLDAGDYDVIVDGGTLDDSIKNSLGDSVKYAPDIQTESLPNGTEGTSYSQTLTATSTTPITWSIAEDSSLPAGLSLGADTGVISGIPTAAGTYSFTVTATNDYGSDSKEFTLTIDQQGTIHVTSVSLDKTSLELTEDGTGTLIATVLPDNASNKNVTWESSNTSVATVDANGLVTAVSAGTATITATADGKSATCTVTVTAATVPVTGVTMNKTSTSLYVGDTETLTATVQPGNASNQAVTWSTSNPSVATVENGVVRATGRGTATITVTTADGNYTATCTVTVSRYSTGGGPTTYAVTAPDVENGTVRVSPSRTSRGTTVTITVTPDEGYELESLTVLDSRDNEITLTDKGDGKYTFTMPSGRVTVEASFAEIAPEPLPFGDVDDGDWFADAVRFVYENGMMNGVSETSFAPHATTSRCMLVTILYRLEGEPVVDYAMDFTDVAEGEWYTEAVRWAASESIVGGYGGGLFGTNDAVTREQLAAILYRYAAYKGYDVSIGEDTNILSYDDFADLSEYAIPAMQWACGAGIVNGTSESTLTPQGEATRAQVAAMLMRFCESIVQ